MIMGKLIYTGIGGQTRSMLNTYAPHMGYHTDQVVNYCDTINQYLNIAPKTYILILRTGNNGEIASSSQDSDNKTAQFPLSNKTDKGNGGNLMRPPFRGGPNG